MFEITDAIVDAVPLLQQERGVKPRRWITGIDLLRESKFRFRVALVTRVAEGFAEVTAQQRTLWLSGGGNVKIEAALLSVARRSRFVAGCWGAGGGGMALPAFTARVRRVRA